ncbi:Axonemal dynein heavy chain, partial [Globisporangium splendens]
MEDGDAYVNDSEMQGESSDTLSADASKRLPALDANTLADDDGAGNDGDGGAGFHIEQEQHDRRDEGSGDNTAPARESSRYSAEEHLMERFRLHKQHRKEKEAALKKTRQAAGARGTKSLSSSGATSKFKPSPIAMLSSSSAGGELTRVDHNNRPHRWKDASVVMREMEIKSHQKMLRNDEPVKPFPGKLRKKIYNMENSEIEQATNVSAAPSSSSESRRASRVSHETAKPPVETDEFLKIDQSQFPLHLFDSEEFETRSPQEWLAQGDTGSSPYFYKGEWHWRKCVVQSHDTEKQKFLIQFQGSDKQKWVKRINLRFESETPEVFQQRVDEAVRRREDAKAQLRFDHFLAKQSASDLKAMSRQTLEKIHVRVISGLPEQVALVDGQPAAVILRTLIDATIQGYMRSMKKSVLLDQLRYNEELQQKYVALNLILPAPPPPVPEYGKIAIPDHAYEKNRKKIGATHYTCSSQLLSVLSRMYAGWEKTFQKLYLIQVDTPASSGNGQGAGKELSAQFPFWLLDFKTLQTNHQNKAAEILLIDWRRSIVENITDNLQDHFDFFVSDVNAYLSSKLRRIITGIEIRMAAHLRQIVTQTIREWVEFVRETTAVSPLAENEQWRSHRASLFDVQLGFVHGRVVVEPSTKEIVAVMVEPLEAIFSSVQEIDAIDCDIMSLLALERRRLLDFEGDRAVVAECVDGISHAKEQIIDMVTVAMEAAQQLTAEFEKHTDFVHFDPVKYLAELKEQPDPAVYLSEICSQIRRFHQLSFRIDLIAYDAVPLPLVCVNTLNLKQYLKTRAIEIRNVLIDSIARDAREKNMDITLRYEAILRRINDKPTNEAQLARLKEFVNESKAVIAGIVKEVDQIHERLDAMNEFSHKPSNEDFKLAYSTKEWPLRVAHAADTCDSALEEDKVRMMDRLALEKEAFALDLERFESEVQAFKLYGEINQTEKYVELAVNLFDSLQDAKTKALDFNAREAVFNFPPTEYSILGKLEGDFSPYYKLWTMCSEFNQSRQAWLNGPFLELKGPEIEALVTEWWKSSYKLSKTLMEEAPGSAEVALALRERTEAFKAYLPVIQSLASPALQERHWENLRQKVGFDETEEELTLNILLEKGITQHIETVQEIGAFAEKEYSLQKNLNAMIAEWEKIEFQCVPYRETGTYLIRSTDDIIAMLDDHLVKTQIMRGSPCIKCVEKDCKAWEKKLQYSQQLLDEWMACQRTWLYLEAIFSSEDIMRQMPTEARRFASVDALWRKTMEDTVADPNFMTVVAMDKLLQKFQKANEKLDEIQKGLNDYLEMERLHFPRFFFLSNDELLEILSQTKEPKAIQPHLGKCFEGISKVTFTETLLITEMISAEGEVVPLRLTVNPESTKNKGNVEVWLLEVEQNQWDSVCDHTQRAIGTYSNEPRETWILKWPAQVVLAASQVYWTQDATRAINQNGNVGLRAYVEVLNKQLDKVVILVRGSLTKLERTTIGALVVIDVRARDTIVHVIEKSVENDQDFEWISQLRYYWIEGAKTAGVLDLQARIVNARVKYGYEYLGNSMRLVITPLTDRCYRTMMGAIDLLYGGAPEGPAGTGKTETVKDLSKAIAIQCVVFNCSDGLDYLAMAKVFKGLAGCGSWCCFDELNRINIEVLSVIAQQILTINEGKKANVDKFLFEGTFIKLNASANVFITMNPGYAGRPELPDNLKALFRPCAMMVPDYALISEIRLYSFGFSNARSNARKLTQVLQLSSEQLSSQKHYDCGMRAVNSILVAAGHLRQLLGNDPFWTEDKIVLRSVQDVNLPKFTTDDLPLFRGITSDLFPGAHLPNPDHGALLLMIDTICEQGVSIIPDISIPLECKPEFKMKVIQFYETVQVRHGLMIVGQTGSGKTCIVHTLATAMTACNTESNSAFQNRVLIHTMNPKSITSGQLYGNFDENTHEWSDGVLACTYRECARDTSEDLQWVMFDGPVDAVWIENMNTVLDDNKKLCLMSGEIVKMADRMRMMFETEDLEEASPATVSRVGMVFVEPKNLGWEVLMRTWLRTRLPVEYESKKGFLEETFLWLVPPMLYFVEKNCTVPTPVTFLEHGVRCFGSLNAH